jgi:hypothetical protein
MFLWIREADRPTLSWWISPVTIPWLPCFDLVTIRGFGRARKSPGRRDRGEGRDEKAPGAAQNFFEIDTE